MEKIKEKERIRKIIKERLKTIGFDEILNKSQTILSQLKQLQNFDNVQQVFCYISKSDELHTHELIRYLLARKVHLWVPKMDASDSTLQLKRLSNWEKDLQIGPYGILEPKEDLPELNELDKIELFLIPGRAFDSEGYRIGRGKGFFDRFLAKIKYPDRIAGLCLEEQVFDHVPYEPHDIKMSKLITNQRILEFQGS